MNDQPVVTPLPEPRYAAEPASAEIAVGGQPGTVGFVYAVGRLQARFSTLGAEREYAQVANTDPDAPVRTAQLKEVLGAAENRHLARQMCWVFGGASTDACAVIPRDEGDLAQLIDLLEPEQEQVIHALVGSPAVGATPTPCLSAGLPAAWPEQLLSFTMDEFTNALPRPGGARTEKDEQTFRQAVRDAFAQLTQRADNRGLSDEHRALNYLALRYAPIYHLTAQALADGKGLIGVDARPTSGGDRRVVAVRLIFRHPQTNLVERYHCPVDVTDVFPFPTGQLTQTYD